MSRQTSQPRNARAAAAKAVRARSLMESAAVLEAAVVAVERRPVPPPDALDAKLVEMLASPFTRARRLSRRLLSTTEAAPEITDDALTATTLSNFSSHRHDQFGPKIVKFRAILAIFQPFEDFRNGAETKHLNSIRAAGPPKRALQLESNSNATV